MKKTTDMNLWQQDTPRRVSFDLDGLEAPVVRVVHVLSVEPDKERKKQHEPEVTRHSAPRRARLGGFEDKVVHVAHVPYT